LIKDDEGLQATLKWLKYNLMAVEKNSRTLDDVGTKEIPKKVMCVYIYIYIIVIGELNI
jgi:hypothetical protein